MVDSVKSPTFEYAQASLAYHNASEVHGLLCGMLCINGSLNSEVWLNFVADEMPEDKSLTKDAQNLLLELLRTTLTQLKADGFNFTLLLPCDRTSLQRRTLSLGSWCQGFLTGLGLGGMQSGQALSAEVDEFLQDLLNIARVGFDTDDTREEDERAYTEIVEYVRIGVLLVEQELSPPSTLTRLH